MFSPTSPRKPFTNSIRKESSNPSDMYHLTSLRLSYVASRVLGNFTCIEDTRVDFGSKAGVPIPVLATYRVTTNYVIFVHPSFCIYKMGIITVPPSHMSTLVKIKCLVRIKFFINTRYYYYSSQKPWKVGYNPVLYIKKLLQKGLKLPFKCLDKTLPGMQS